MPYCRVRRRDILYPPLGKITTFNEHVLRAVFFSWFYGFCPARTGRQQSAGINGRLEGWMEAENGGLHSYIVLSSSGTPCAQL